MSIQQTRKVLASLTVAVLLFGAYATAARAQVPPFSAYGSGLKAGDKVEAFDNARSCGSGTADASGNWILRIASNAQCAPSGGDKITFTLNGAPTTASEIYKAGGAPKDVARGVTLTVTAAAPTSPAAGTGAPAPAKTGNAGLLPEQGSGFAWALALGALALIAAGVARTATSLASDRSATPKRGHGG